MGRPISERKGEQVSKFMNEFPEGLRRALSSFFLERGVTNPSTKYSYVLGFRVFIREMGKDPLKATEEDYREFHERLVMRGSSERTIEVYMGYSKAFFSWYRPRDNPLSWWKSGRGRKRKRELRDKILSSEEIEALVKVASKPMTKAIITVM